MEFVGQTGRKDMRVTQDNRIPRTLFGSIPINLTLCIPWQGRRQKYRFVAVVVDTENDVLAADVFVDSNIILIDVVSPSGKLVVVGKGGPAGRGVGI